MTTPYLIAGPNVEPVSLAEMRLHLRLDDATAEDGLIADLIRAARLAVEAASGRVLIESRYGLSLTALPASRRVALAAGPVIAIEGLTVEGADGTPVAVAASALNLDRTTDPACLVLGPGVPAPRPGSLGGIAVSWRAGFGPTPAAVPEPLRQAVRLLAARLYERRGDEEAAPLPPDFAALIAPFRPMRL